MTHDRNGDGRAYSISLSFGVCVSLILNMQTPFTCVYYTTHTFAYNTIQERKYMNASFTSSQCNFASVELLYLQLVRLRNDTILRMSIGANFYRTKFELVLWSYPCGIHWADHSARTLNFRREIVLSQYIVLAVNLIERYLTIKR